MRQSKYGARKVSVDNIRFDSKAEARYYERLKVLKRAKQIADFDLQPEFIIHDGFERDGKKYRATKYRGDFLVTHLDGRQEVVDVKGVKTQVYEIKKKLFLDRYRDLTLVEEMA